MRRGNRYTHGGRWTKEYNIWCHIKGRCFNKRNKKYPDYGGRGITMCIRWKNSFQDFLLDMGRCPPGFSIERTNNNKNYEPGNCKWATQKTQQRNRRDTIFITHRNTKRSLPEWSEITGIPYHTLFARYSGRSGVQLFKGAVGI